MKRVVSRNGSRVARARSTKANPRKTIPTGPRATDGTLIARDYTSPAMPTETFDARGRPRIWQHDYLHLRPLARDVAARGRALGEVGRVLDVGSGGAPYRSGFAARDYHRVDLDPKTLP